MPPSRKLRLTRTAEDDLAQTIQYSFETWGQPQADVYSAKLHGALVQLCDYPDRGVGRDQADPTLKSVFVEEHVIIYRVVDDMVVVARIIHKRRDWHAAIERVDDLELT